MNENEIMTTTEIEEDYAVRDCSNHSGLKTFGAVALTAAIGTGLFFGVKKLVKNIKDRKKDKYVADNESVPVVNDEVE